MNIMVMNIMVTTNQKKTLQHTHRHTHTLTQRESNPNISSNQMGGKSKRTNKNYKNNQTRINKMAISIYLSVITLKIN